MTQELAICQLILLEAIAANMEKLVKAQGQEPTPVHPNFYVLVKAMEEEF